MQLWKKHENYNNITSQKITNPTEMTYAESQLYEISKNSKKTNQKKTENTKSWSKKEVYVKYEK